MTATIYHGDCLDVLRAVWDYLAGLLPQTPALGQDLDDLAGWTAEGEGE